MHCPKARCGALGHRQNLGFTAENLSFENAKAPDYGAFSYFFEQHAQCLPKLARPLQ
ncbi:hypothetical protein [Pseudomonas sp. Au-Pse12]|uniref:hypothetical protein n=1 Tax=Pseudomonas sp. Au-Pse12 TaxID=2906459 RepID=UPI001E5A9E56|nr:hypothetical protein [Pseudomonas sp. Au-Pse12]MCE4055942.1 hypothetical protein [Pseudomonas sp. Au-Pse12]